MEDRDEANKEDDLGGVDHILDSWKYFARM